MILPPDRGRFRENSNVATKRSGVRGGQSYFGLAAVGDFGGGTLKALAGVQMPDGVNYTFPIAGVQLTAPGYLVFAVAADYVAVELSGATNPDLQWALV